MFRLPQNFIRRAEYAAVALAVLFIAVMAAVGLWFGFDEARSQLARLSPTLIAGMLVLSLGNYVLRALRWHCFQRRLGIEVPLGRTALYYFAGFAMTTTPGKVGEALRLWLLERCHGLRYERTAPLLIGDRIGDAVSNVLLCLIGLSAFGAYYATGTLFAAGAMLAVLVLLLRPEWALRMILGLHGVAGGRWPRLFGGIRTILRKTARLFDPRLFALATLLGTLGWFCECLAFHWLLVDMGTHLSLQQTIFIFAFSMLIGAASMLPGGLGGTEATMFALFTLVGVAPETAFAATVIIRLTTLWFAVLLGFLALPVALRLARVPASGRLEAQSTP
jgi:uncharacterized membrane protein YbhN (UPF0104 family)